MMKKMPIVENSSLILRFLRTLKLSDYCVHTLIFKCAAEGSKFDLLAIIDGNIDENYGYHFKFFENFPTVHVGEKRNLIRLCGDFFLILSKIEMNL